MTGAWGESIVQVGSMLGLLSHKHPQTSTNYLHDLYDVDSEFHTLGTGVNVLPALPAQ